MAAALHPLRNNAHSTLHAGIYPGLDYQDVRYPTLAQSKNPQRASAFVLRSTDRPPWGASSNTTDDLTPRRSYEPPTMNDAVKNPWAPEQRGHQYQGPTAPSADRQSLTSQSQQSQSQEPQRSMLSYALPPSGATRRVLERYSLDENNDPAPSRSSGDTRPQDSSSSMPPAARRGTSPSNTPRHPSLNLANNAAALGSNGPFAMPLSASPSYNPPVAPNPRAYAQQPTYITPPSTPTPIRTVYSPQPVAPPPDEICVECAMRDQDMADVDVTSPGVWERESDVAFEEMKRRELEDARNGVVPKDESRPRTKGGRLTEQNLKIWLSINPREPASRHQTLRAYIVSQRALLEADALAHARAQQDARRLDNRISMLRRSTYDLGVNNGTATPDESGGLRIKPPRSPVSPNETHSRSQSRDITLLDNGFIVEHVDVQKEEKEARDRRRKEGRRARKSSRSSATLDVGSIISANSIGPAATDSGVGGLGGGAYPRYSTAFSDVHSMGSASPRRTRFFGVKNLGAGWKSQDSLAPSAMSGSMVDMHIALHREGPVDSNTQRRSRLWWTSGPENMEDTPVVEAPSDDKSKKKKKGLAKIWGIVTGKHGDRESASRGPSPNFQEKEGNEDDGPLPPPPSISYLVNRGSGEIRGSSNRHVSSPVVQSFCSSKPNPLAIPPSATVLPSPPSSRLSNPDVENTEKAADDKENQYSDDTVGKSLSRGVHPVTSEPNMRRHSQRQTENIPPVPTMPGAIPRPPPLASRDKSLPPLPGEPGSRMLSHNLEPRPRTVYTYDPRQRPAGASPAHDFLPPNAPFRGSDSRRQSFGGMSSRPNLVAQTMPVNSKQQGFDPRTDFGTHYNEFGTSRRSLTPLDASRTPAPGEKVATKRKSKFGLGLFGMGKKSTNAHEQEEVHPFPSSTLHSGWGMGGEEELSATSNSRHSVVHTGRPGTRLSMTSRKALEERVMQDPQFVAYRYPSSGQQQLEMFR